MKLSISLKEALLLRALTTYSQADRPKKSLLFISTHARSLAAGGIDDNASGVQYRAKAKCQFLVHRKVSLFVELFASKINIQTLS